MRRCAPVRCLILATGITLCMATPLMGEDADDGVEQKSFYSANGLLNRGLYELAAAEYAAFLAAYPDHGKAPAARYGLAVCHVRTGRHDAAIEQLEPLTGQKDFTYAAEVHALLAQCQLAQKHYDQAASACAHVVKKHAGHALADDAAAMLVEALYLAGERERAIEACETFEQRWSGSPLSERVDYFWGLSLMAQEQYGAAAEKLERLCARFGEGAFADHATLLIAQCRHRDNALVKAAEWYRRVLDRAASAYTGDALLGLARLTHGQGNLDEAGELLDRLLRVSDHITLLSPARLERGRVWFDQERYDRALPLFEQVAEDGGELADDAAYWAAKCVLRHGDHADAAKRLALAFETHPQSELGPEMLYDRIVALMRLEDDAAADEAIETFSRRFARHALAADTLYLAAVIDHRRQHYDASREHCRRFLEQYPKHPSAAQVAFLVAENEYLNGDYAEAIEAYELYQRRFPTDAQQVRAAYRVGMALYRSDRAELALRRLESLPEKALRDDAFRPALYALGDIRFHRGEWKQAEQRLTAYLADDAEVAAADDALLKIGIARQRQEEHEGALRAFEQLLKRFDDSPHRLQAAFERGQALVGLERFDAAREVFEQVLAEHGDSRFAPFAHNHLGAIAMRARRYRPAAGHFARASESLPDAPLAAEALYQQGQALLLLEEYAAADEVFAAFLERHAGHRRMPWVLAQRVITCSRRDRCADALEVVAQAERGGLAEVDASLQAAVRYEKAWCLRKLGEQEKAGEVYRSLLAGPDTGLRLHATLELAEIEAQAKRHAQAADLLRGLRREIEQRPNELSRAAVANATYRLGICEFELGRMKEAAELLEEFVGAFGEHELAASASFFCGEALYQAGQHARAARHLTRVVEEHEEGDLHAPSLLRLGETLSALQRWAPSEKAFTDYLERYGDREQWFQAQFGIGWARENQSRYAEAIAAYTKVAARHQGPTAARAQFQIGECLFAQKKYDDAVREFLKVDILYAYPEWSAAALYEAGRCFEALGKLVEAREHFKTVAERHEQTRWAELATQRLAAMPRDVLPGRTQ